MVAFKRGFLIHCEPVINLATPSITLTHQRPLGVSVVAHPLTSWLCRHHNILNIMASVLSPRSITTGPKPYEVRISCARDVVRDRAPGIVGVHATAAKLQILPYNVSNAPNTLLHFASTPIAPSIMSGAEHVRSGSPDPLPVLPRHRQDSYRGDRARRSEPERHRSHRRHDYDRGQGRVHDGEVRVQGRLHINPIYHDSSLVCFSSAASHPAASHGRHAD